MSENQVIVQTSELTKRFDEVFALRDVTLHIKKNRIVGLLGLNGAGKSTLLRHFVGLHIADAGKCRVFGANHYELQAAELSRIGYVHQGSELLSWMTVPQIVRYVRAYYPNWNEELQDKLIESFEIPLNGRIATLSPGEVQKLAILLAVCYEPELLILDEPAAALDPVARANFLDLLLEMIQEENRTIIISSHILSDVEKIIDDVVILHKGKVATDNSLDFLKEQYIQVQLTSATNDLPDTLALPTTGTKHLAVNGRQARFTALSSVHEEIRQYADQLHCAVETRGLSLEELFRLHIGK